MKPETYISAVILLIAVFILVYGILTIVRPSFILKRDDKGNEKITIWKASLFSFAISFPFTLVIAFISEKIDDVSAGKRIFPRKYVEKSS